MHITDLPPGGVLALDLSSTTGWAYGPLEAVVPACGTWALPYVGGEGARYTAFENILADAMEALCPARMVIEAPLVLQAHTQMRTTAQQLGLRAIAYIEAYRASCVVSEIGATNVRLALLGQAWFAKDRVKREVYAYARKRGAKPCDHNAADACLVWWWHQGQMRGAPSKLAGPLFQEGGLNAT